MVSQQLNARDDAVLAEGKSTHTMIAGRTQPARTLIALNHRRILSMVATVHHCLKTLLTDCYDRFLPVCGRKSLSADLLPVFVREAPGVFVPSRR